MERDPEGLEKLLEQMEFFLPSRSTDLVIQSINLCDKRYDAVIHETTFRERSEKMGDLVSAYCRGFERLVRKYKIKPGRQFDWLAENYGRMFQAGSDETVEGIEFASRRLSADSALLIIFPDNNYFDGLVREYEKIWRASSGKRDVQFDKDNNRTNPVTLTYYRNIYIKIKSE